MKPYQVAAEEIVIGEETFQKGDRVSVDDKNEEIAKAIEKGDLVAIPEIVYVVVKGPIANLQGEVFQIGNEVPFLEGDSLAETFVAQGMIIVKGSGTEKKEEEIAAPVTPADTSNTEPRARYRGQVVISESVRTVEAQSFRHIRLEDGSEMDLTEQEYAYEVHVSYPPQK